LAVPQLSGLKSFGGPPGDDGDGDGGDDRKKWEGKMDTRVFIDESTDEEIVNWDHPHWCGFLFKTLLHA
jgi:hypothetical protein